ncbi:MAG: M20/M25/M40 family metallo-hydrolase [Bacteroidales bacterium]|nr:M20/M25/M40 family metallo-hydrolase [Bacteroidales bacterium]
MKKKLSFIFILMLCLLSEAQTDFISSVAEYISADSIKYNTEQLESFPSRYTFSVYSRDVAMYLEQRMLNYGFEVETDSFYVENFVFPSVEDLNSQWIYNILALKKGKRKDNKKAVILGAHFDCTSHRLGYTDYKIHAPGADDNASGVAALLEIARIWDKLSISSEYDIRIEFYGGEEQGLTGSDNRLKLLSKTWYIDVLGMINLDMIGYNESNILNINIYDNSDDLSQKAISYTESLTDLSTELSTEYIQNSDSWTFYSWGFKTVFLTEHDFSPYYHTPQDSSVYLDFEYMRKVTCVAAALALDYAEAFDNTVGLDTDNQEYKFIISEQNKEHILFCFSPKNINATEASIIDGMGRTMLSTKLNNTPNSTGSYQIDIGKLSSGFYILCIKTDKGLIRNKFLKH